MRPIYFALFILLTPIFSFASSTTTIDVSADAYINEINQVRNYGSSQDLFVQSGPSKNKRALIYFNLPTLPLYTEIEKAEVRIYANEIPDLPRTYGIYSLSSGFVEGNGGEDNIPESEVRWNNKPESVFLTSTTTPEVKNNFMVFDVTSFVSNVYSGNLENFGFQIADVSEENEVEVYSNFRPKEYSSASRRPKLDLTYTLPINNISGNVFEDKNLNGIFDEGDQNLDIINVSISGSVSTTTVTDPDGNFLFESLPNGSYDVCIDVLEKQIQTFPTLNTNCNEKSSFSLVLDSNSTTTYEANFGVFTDTESPDIPIFITPENNSISDLATTTFSWEPVLDPSSPVIYVFSYSNDSGTTTSNSFLNTFSVSTTTDTLLDIALNPGEYFFNIRSCDSFLNCSDFSDVKQIQIISPEIENNSTSSDPGSSNSSSEQQIISNGPIVGSYGSFIAAPTVPVNTQAPTPQSSPEPVLTNAVAYTPEINFNQVGNNQVVVSTPRNDLSSNDSSVLSNNDSSNIIESLEKDTVSDTVNIENSQVASVSESGQNIGWKLSMVLVIILVLGGVYIFTKN